MIDKETKVCISIASNPSNMGTRLHNFAYKQLKLNFIYKAFSVTDIAATIRGVRALGIRGCSVSMPFKETALPYLDDLDPIASNIGAVNTIVNNNGLLKGYNTDYIAVVNILAKLNLNNNTSVTIIGAGGMAKAILFGLKNMGIKSANICCRNKNSFSKIKEFFNVEHLNWAEKDQISSELIINASPLGMGVNSGDQVFEDNTIENSKHIIDVVSKPFKTKLITKATKFNKNFIPGHVLALEQMISQFQLYTEVQAPRYLIEKEMEKILNSV